MLAGRKHMAHYDLYQALNLDRSKTPEEISAELSNRLENNELDNIGGREEVEIARAILGDPQKRTAYDSRLDDPNAPEVDVNALRQLAAADFSAGTAPAGDPAAGAAPADAAGAAGMAGAAGAQHSPEKQGPSLGERFKEAGAKTQQQVAPAMEKTKKEFGRSSKMAILITAIATAVVMLLLFTLFNLFTGNSGPSDVGHSKKVTQLIELRDKDKTEKWIQDNVQFDFQDNLRDRIDIDDDYRGMDRFLDTEEPKVLRSVDVRDAGLMEYTFDEDRIKDAYKKEGIKKIYFSLIGDKNGKDSRWRVGVIEFDDGKIGVDFLRSDDSPFDEDIEDLKDNF